MAKSTLELKELIRRKADSKTIKCDIAKWANKQTPLGIDALWDKSWPTSPLVKMDGTVQNSSASWGQIILNTLLGSKPEIVELHLEIIYEELNTSPVLRTVSPPDSRVWYLVDNRRLTPENDMISMNVYGF